MEFAPTGDQRALIDSVGKLATAGFGTPRRRQDIPDHTPREFIKILTDNGLAGISLPESVGGQGGSLLDAVLVIETIARINPVAGDAVQALNFGAIQQLAHLGNAYIKSRYLQACLAGKMLPAIAMTEQGAGSGVTGLKTTARVEGDHVTVNGGKIFITHGGDADFFVVWARFGVGRDDVGAVVVERGSSGFSVNSANTFLSGEAYGILSFDDCVVPAANVVVSQHGFRAMLPVFNIERLGNAARSLALGQAAFDLALEHVRVREQFGAPLSSFQGLRWRLAEMAVKLESARLLLYRAASNDADGGLPSVTDTAMAKLSCNRAGFEVADCALQMLGGQGFDSESVIGYLLHRTRGWMIAGGTVEQMLNRIATGVISGTSLPGTETRVARVPR